MPLFVCHFLGGTECSLGAFSEQRERKGERDKDRAADTDRQTVILCSKLTQSAVLWERQTSLSNANTQEG